MTITRAVGVALLVAMCGLWPSAGLSADEPQGGAGGGESALELGLGALRLRMQAKLKEADLLEKSGRLDEALAATREVDRLYREGLAELQRLLAAAPAKAQGPAPAPAAGREAPLEPPADDAADTPADGWGAGVGRAFKGRGGSREAGQKRRDDAVLHGLRWLVAHQSEDGGWESEGFGRWCDGKEASGERPDGPGKPVYDVGVTGLALCAFLGAGYTHRGDHEFAKVVSRGLAYLKNVQDTEGCIGPRVTQHYFYNHAIASLAMVEAYGMTESPIYLSSAQKALDFIALARNPYFAWRYGVKPGDNDTSTTAWAIMALKSAKLINEDKLKNRLPAPLTIDEGAFAGAKSWLDKMTDPDYGRVGYVSRGTGPARPQELVDRFPPDKSESLTAIGVLLRIFFGEDPKTSDMIQKGVHLMRRLPPTWNAQDGSIDMYYWYYGTLGMFQVGGDAWKKWEQALNTSIIANQRMDGTYCSFKGSWDPIDPWGPEGGRVYATALMTLCCEVSFRYDRVFGTK